MESTTLAECSSGDRCLAVVTTSAAAGSVAWPAQAQVPGSVVVADDDPALLAAASRALRARGYDVAAVADGDAALRMAREQLPDVVLLDVAMPGLDGIEVCRRLKQEASTRLIPVVLMTGSAGREARMTGLEAGAADFLSKPFDLMELEARVRNLARMHRLTRDLDSSEEIVLAIARAVEARDKGTGDHCERLAALTVRFGRYLGLGEEDLVALRRAGYLHDLGKIAVPDAVLLKPGPLSPEEWQVMREHPVVGAEICAGLHTLRAVLPVIQHHHERWDGSGYPGRLAGEQIPYLARVFQVVDIFDALSNERSYSEPLPAEQALAILRDEARSGLVDPLLVEAFCGLLSGERAAATAGPALAM